MLLFLTFFFSLPTWDTGGDYGPKLRVPIALKKSWFMRGLRDGVRYHAGPYCLKIRLLARHFIVRHCSYNFQSEQSQLSYFFTKVTPFAILPESSFFALSNPILINLVRHRYEHGTRFQLLPLVQWSETVHLIDPTSSQTHL